MITTFSIKFKIKWVMKREKGCNDPLRSIHDIVYMIYYVS